MRKFAFAGSVGLVLGACLATTSARALPGMHGPAVSTFDTRASTVVLAYRHSLSDVTARVYSYNANFTSTSGNFSAQFGAHYLQFRDIPEAPLAHGAGATGVGLFSLPLSRRHSNGVPITAMVLYAGATPAAAVSGPRNFLTAPLAVGLGVSYSPASWVTLTPWFEAAPSANLDTFISTEGIEIKPTRELTIEDLDDPVGAAGLEDSFRQALDDAVDTRFYLDLGLRTGLMASAHLGRRVDLQAGVDFSTLGSTFGGEPVVQLVTGLAFRWDSIVPAVLTAKERLSEERCEDVEERFRMCPQAAQWLERQTPAPASPEWTPAEPAPTPPPVDAPPPATEPPTPELEPAVPSPAAPPPEAEPMEPGPAETDVSGPPEGAFPPPAASPALPLQ